MFIIYTKIDTTPSNIYEINLEYIKNFYKSKMNLKVQVMEPNMTLETPFTRGSDIVPLFSVSNVAGTGLTQVKEFLLSLNKTINYKEDETRPANFLINRIYQVQGIGIVLSGNMRSGIIKRNDILYIGPNATGYTRDADTNIITATPQDNIPNFYKVIIKGIHNNFQENVDCLKAGYSGCFNIKPIGRNVIKRSMIRPGMRLLGAVHSVIQFQAKVKICNSSSTITNKYQPVVHCGGISQSVQIVKMDKEYLRSYDECIITFRFMYRPEYLEVGNIFIMREGNLKALGKVLQIDK